MPKLHRLFSVVMIGVMAVGLGLSAATVQAEDIVPSTNVNGNISLTAIPPRVGDEQAIKIKPGEKFQTTVRILNPSNVDLDVDSSVKDFIIGEDGKTPVPVQDTVENRWSLASWITLAPSHQTVPAKKTVGLSVLIDVPKDARPGGHYAMILHQPSKAGSVVREEGQSRTGVNQEVGSLLYVIVDGPIDELAFIRGFAFKPNFAEWGPVNFSYAIDNQSDIHIRPTGSIVISDIFRRQVGKLDIETQNVFPGAQRNFVGTWPVKWGFGPYTALMTVAYGDHGQLVTAKAVVWLLPVSIIIAILGVLLALLTVYIVIKRRKNTPPGASPIPPASADTTAQPTIPPSPPLV